MQVQGEHELVGLGINLPHWFAASITANRIDQDIEMTMTSGNSIHQRAACGFVRGIKRQELKMGMCAHGVAQGICFVLLYVCGDDRCAFMKQRERYCTAQAAGASGHEGNLVGETVGHVPPSGTTILYT